LFVCLCYFILWYVILCYFYHSFYRSLENLELQLEIIDPSKQMQVPIDQNSFVAKGLTLEAAGWDYSQSCLSVTIDMSTSLPLTKFTWKIKDEKTTQTNAKQVQQQVLIPIYLNDTRAEFLVSIDLNVNTSVSSTTIYLRGTAITVWRTNV
jgi:hypothetical protein